MGWEELPEQCLGEEELLVQQTARSFARQELAPLAVQIDQQHWFPQPLIPKLGALGFMGAMLPNEFDGAGLSTLAYATLVEELAVECASTSIIVSAHNSLCLAPILAYGSAAQKAQYLPPLARGEQLGCFALSEPGTGSDAAALTCSVRAQGEQYVINGTKNWITNGPVAGTCVLFAMLDPSKGHKGVCAFVHPMNLPGISLGKKEDKLGICGSPTSSITYQEVLLGKQHLLGAEGEGFKVAMSTLNGGRIGVAAQALGIARAALRDALAYSKQRRTFGKFLHEHQSIQNYLAEMVTRIEASRFLIYSAASRKDRGQDYARQAAMAKLFASETALWCADKGIQIHGGYGYVRDFPAERHLRDAKITEIYEGTSEIQRMVIAAQLVKE
jgi:butyryl-CoA dehydrogenase